MVTESKFTLKGLSASDLRPEPELTIAARIRGWDLRVTNIEHLAQFDALPLRSMVAATAGLHPYFADESWCFGVAIPYFAGDQLPDEDIDVPVRPDDDDARQALVMLDSFVRRLQIAMASAQAGTLAVVGADDAGPIVSVRTFARYCSARVPPWALPGELASTGADKTPELAPRIPIMRANEQRIANALIAAGFDPMHLPLVPQGGSCPAKAAAFAGAKLSKAAFNHAWKALPKKRVG